MAPVNHRWDFSFWAPAGGSEAETRPIMAFLKKFSGEGRLEASVSEMGMMTGASHENDHGGGKGFGQRKIRPVPRLSTLTCLIVFCVLIFPLSCPVSARASATFIPPIPADAGQVEIYLLTRGPGDEVYTKYGHTIIRVVDPSRYLDLAYNWGAFDFDEPGFVVKFLRGFLRYHLEISPTTVEIRISDIEQRWLVQERLNLTARQKGALLQELNREAQPDRRYYRYLFFTDNCSTRPRDLIDRALGGKIAETFQGKGSGSTFRDEVMAYNASAPILAMGQDVILNREVDRPISRWEEMFVPLKLRSALLEMPAYDDDGRIRTGERLLSGTTTLVRYPEPEKSHLNGYQISWGILGLPILLGALLGWRPALRKTAARMVGLALTAWGVASGGFGLYMALSWGFSEHTVIQHNANLWLFWPVDSLFLLPGILLLRKGWAFQRRSLLAKGAAGLLWGHLAALGIYGFLALGDLFRQEVMRVLSYFGSYGLLLYGLTLYLLSTQDREPPSGV